MIKVLFAEDDANLNEVVTNYLTDSGFNVFACHNGKEALKIFEKENVDLILTDIMMSDIDGFQLVKEIRLINKTIPIFFMTALDDINSKTHGYNLEIDDYIVKPFELDELKMRINALLRRANIKNSKKLEIGNFKMDSEEHTAYYKGEEMQLTVREFDILFKLLSFPKKTFTRSQLMEMFWDYDSSATSRTVDVYMAKLREKTSICNEFDIVTVHGLGYKVVLNEK